MGTFPAIPTESQIPPIYQQDTISDPKSGVITSDHWWFLFQLRQLASGAAQSSALNTVVLTPSGGVVTPDLSLSGPLGSFEVTLDGTTITVANPINGDEPIPGGAQITMYFDEDNIGGHPGPTFAVGPGGFSSDVNTLAIIRTANTRTTYVFGYDGVSWTLKSFQTGQTI